MARQKMGSTRRKAKVTGRRKTHRRKRARVGAVGNFSGIATKLAGLGVGAVASREIITLIAKMFPTMTPTIAAMLQIALGIFTPQLVKSSFGNDMGDGAAAAGFQNLLVNLGVISGVNGPNDRMSYRVNPAMVNGGNFGVVAGTAGRRRIAGAEFSVVGAMPNQQTANNTIPQLSRAIVGLVG